MNIWLFINVHQVHLCVHECVWTQYWPQCMVNWVCLTECVCVYVCLHALAIFSVLSMFELLCLLFSFIFFIWLSAYDGVCMHTFGRAYKACWLSVLDCGLCVCKCVCVLNYPVAPSKLWKSHQIRQQMEYMSLKLWTKMRE